MGLDVSLHYYEDYLRTSFLDNEYEKKSEEVWDKGIEAIGKKGYGDLTDGEKEKIQSKIDVIEYSGPQPKSRSIEIDSVLHPEHMFKIGYWRSSYNPSGINQILRQTINKDLYYLIGGEHDKYVIEPDWPVVLSKAQEILEAFREWVKEFGDYGIIEDSFYFMNVLDPNAEVPCGKESAMKVFTENLKRNNGRRGGYSNREGQFFFDGNMKLAGVIKGKSSFGDAPATYIVYSCPNMYDHYTQSLEVVKETAEWVLQQEDSDRYYLHWSG